MKVKVFHFSPKPGLKVLEPNTPSHSDYADYRCVYLATSIESCQMWADAMTLEGYRKPPFHFYCGDVELSSLYKFVLKSNTEFDLAPVLPSEVGEIDQVVCLSPVNVESAA